MCRTMPFSARALNKKTFSLTLILWQKKSKCGLSWSVLLSTTSTRHKSFPKQFFVLFMHVERRVWENFWNESLTRTSSSFPWCSACTSPSRRNRMLFSVALVKFHLFGINWHVFMQKLSFVYHYSENRATSRIWKVLPNMVFPLIWGGKWRRSEHAHASNPGLSFRPPGFSPYMGREERRVQGLD